MVIGEAQAWVTGADMKATELPNRDADPVGGRAREARPRKQIARRFDRGPLRRRRRRVTHGHTDPFFRVRLSAVAALGNWGYKTRPDFDLKRNGLSR